MGEIFYEKGKKYNCRVKGIPYFRTSVTIDGKRRQIYGDGEKDARRKVKELTALAESGINLDAKNQKVEDIFEHWLFDVKRVDRNLKASSFSRYASSYNNHIKPYHIAKIQMIALSSQLLQAYINTLFEDHGASNATIGNVLKVWRMFIDWSINQGYLSKDPCRGLTVPGKYDKKKKVPEFFTDDELTKILTWMKNADYYYATLVKLAIATGMRQGELLALLWENVSETSIEVLQSTGMVTHTDKHGKTSCYREVWETKTVNSSRVIPILPETYEMLMEHKQRQRDYFKTVLNQDEEPSYVFTNKQGGLVKAGTFLESYRRMLEHSGVPKRKFHATRHTFGTKAIRSGVNVKDLQMLMGHADIMTTYIYVHSDEESKANAISLMGKII